jgi:hypothetical protein
MKLFKVVLIALSLILTLQACGQGSSSQGSASGGNLPPGSGPGSGPVNLSASTMKVQSTGSNLKIGTCSLLANVSFLASTGVQAPIAKTLPVSISLSENSVTLFSDSNCLSSLDPNNYTLNEGINSFTLYAMPTSLGNFSLNLKNSLGSLNFQSAVVVGEVNQIGLNLGSAQISIGACSGPYYLHTADNYGDLVSGTLAFSSEIDLAVYNDSDCDRIMTELVTAPVTGQASFYLKGYVVGNGILNITSLSGPASLSTTIQIVH